jgi:hypothetical protein
VNASRIDRLIFTLRGQRVLLDRDLANLYGVTTSALNQAVRRHPARFPGDFMFRLTEDETLDSRERRRPSSDLKSQIVISRYTHGGTRHRPLAFTEQGVAMLSSVLHSERAVQINVAIMRAFVKLRRALMHDANLDIRMERAERALESIEREQGEQAVAVHELMATIRRMTGD